MLEREMAFEEGVATITLRKHTGRKNSMLIKYMGFAAFLSELEVLALTSKGYTASEAAQTLGIAEKTVSNRLKSVRAKNRDQNYPEYHHQSVREKAEKLLLTCPIYIEGLKTIRDNY